MAQGNSNVTIPPLIVPPGVDPGVVDPPPPPPAAAAPVPQKQEPVPQLLASLPAVPQLMAALKLLEDVNAHTELSEPLTRVAAAVTDSAAKGAKTFAFTSIGGTFDAAFASLALARVLASHKVKTIVLDVSPARPHVQDLMAVAAGPGLTDLIAGKADVSKIIVRDPRSNAQAIRMGQEVLSSKSLGERIPPILTSLEKIYDVIILNAGEASPVTPDVVQGVSEVIFLASAARQKDAAAAARMLVSRG